MPQTQHRIERIPIVKLLLDYDLYPRTQIDSTHVTRMIDSLDAGLDLPPIVVDRKTHTILDGFHRYRAYKKLFGKEAEIEAETVNCRDRKEMFLQAIALNAQHGRPLCPLERRRIAVLAHDNFELDDAAVARAMRCTPERVIHWRQVRAATTVSDPGTVVLKTTIGHMAGKQLTARQYAANKRLGGQNQLFYVNQLIELLEADLIDKENARLMEGLKRLAELLGRLLGGGSRKRKAKVG